MTPRSPVASSGSLGSIAAPASRSTWKVPTRLIATTRSNVVGGVRPARAGEPLGVADARAVDRDPQAAGRLRRGARDRCLELLGLRHVGGGEGSALAQLGGERLAARGVEVGDEDVRAALVQCPRGRFAETRGAADHERG